MQQGPVPTNIVQSGTSKTTRKSWKEGDHTVDRVETVNVKTTTAYHPETQVTSEYVMDSHGRKVRRSQKRSQRRSNRGSHAQGGVTTTSYSSNPIRTSTSYTPHNTTSHVSGSYSRPIGTTTTSTHVTGGYTHPVGTTTSVTGQ